MTTSSTQAPGTRSAATERPASRRGRLRTHVAAAFATVALWAALAGWLTPRGPLTSAEAIGSIVVSLAVGAAAGALLRSRWAVLLAPAAFATLFELVRLPVDGPMVDGVHASFYGAIVLLTGRGFHALVALAPMALGAAAGAGLARARAGISPAPAPMFRRAGTVLAGLAVVALVAALARPATTDPITDPGGAPVPGSTAELTTVNIGGRDLGVMIRGASTDNPVLLFLAGGPGGSEFGAMRRHLEGLEDHFTVVTWDQRGAGTSYRELDPTSTVTLEGYVSDTIQLTEALRDRFGSDRIYLLGQSWGTTLGVLAAQQRPDLYHAFIGTGQMVSQRATDRIFYADTLAWAARTGRSGLVSELMAAGPPPYQSILMYEPALSHEPEVYAYDRRGNSEGSGQMSENLLVEEYSLIDQVHILGAFVDTFDALYPQLQDVDFRRSATRFEIPVFFVQGAHEADGRSRLFNEWYPMIEAPTKDLVLLDSSGHRPLWEQPDEFVDYMVTTVLPRTARP